MKKERSYGLKSLLAMTVIMLITAFTLVTAAPQPAAAATTSVTITKYDSDRTTILEQKTVTWQELAAGLLSDGTTMPIMGDGITHYYHQGPVFIDDPDEATEQLLRWDPEETTNWDTKDMGALRGTAFTDLCNLVGGMSEGDDLQVRASDGWYKYFAYENVYQYPSSTGPMVLCWEKNGLTPLTGYNEGMRLVWFAEATYKDYTTSIVGLPPGYYHVFGNWDWHEAAAEEYWYYYMQGSEKYPTTTGLSGQVVQYLNIYSAPPVAPTAAFTADTTNGTAPLAVSFTDQSTGTEPLTYAWDFDNDGTVDSTEQNPSYEYSTAGTYSVKLTVTNSAGSDDEIKTDYITVNPVLPSPPVLTADDTDNTVGQPVTITFVDDRVWRAAITDINVNGDSIAGQYKLAKGKITINAGVFTAAGDYTIVVMATGYGDATVNQPIYGALLTPPVLNADSTDNNVGQAIDITFTDDAIWRAAISDITVNGKSIAGQYTVTEGNINILAAVFPKAAKYTIVVKADGYTDATLTQTILRISKK